MGITESPIETPEPTDPLLSWKPLTLNVDILKSLHDWDKNHGDADEHLPAMLRGVVEKIRKQVTTALDSKGVQIALEAIPNFGTIPAGSIVRGLIWVALLGLVRGPLQCFVAFR